MDLLVLADSTGAVDMTPEAISRRTNVPQPEVEKYIRDLCQPDARSRSDLHEGKRLIPLDSKRDWGWMIVNYGHYRQIKDEEARRTYFRNAQRQYRKGKKVVKDKSLTKFNTNGQVLTPASASSSDSLSVLKEGVRGRFSEWIEVRKAMGKKPRSWFKMFDEQARWLSKFSESDQIEILSQSIRNNWQGLFEPKRKNGARSDDPKPLDKSKIEVPERFKAWVSERYPDRREAAMKWRTWADVPSNGLRDEWWREEKAKLPIGDML